MKYIDVYYYFVKEKVKTEKFKPVYIPSNNNIADLFTKTLLVTILRPKSQSKERTLDQVITRELNQVPSIKLSTLYTLSYWSMLQYY